MKKDIGIVFGDRVSFNTTSVVTGAERVASQFINVLLSDPITLMQDGLGAGLLDKLGQNIKLEELSQITTVRSQQALDLLKERHDEDPTLNDNEKIEEIEIVSITQSGTEVSLKITVTTQAGTEETVGVTI